MKLETELAQHVGETTPEAKTILTDSVESRNFPTVSSPAPMDDMKSVMLRLCNVVIRRSANLQES